MFKGLGVAGPTYPEILSTFSPSSTISNSNFYLSFCDTSVCAFESDLVSIETIC